MQKPLSLGIAAALLLAIFAGACGENGPGADGSVECVAPGDCGPSAECSAGQCVPVTSCTGNEDCTAPQICSGGACRSACDDDADCQALGLGCDLEAGLCLPTDTEPGGSGGGSGSGGSGSGTGGGGNLPTTDVIDDLEDGDAKIAAVGGRVGYWYSYSEAAARPRILAASIALDAGSQVLHASGSHQGGVAADAAYGGLGVDLNNADPNQEGPLADARQPYDASAWDGFSFRIKSASTRSIRFEIVTTAVATPAEGGACSSGTCFDAYGMDVVLAEEWTTVKVPFTQVVQEGWGDQKSFDPSTILGVAFEDLTTGSWDFYVDDLAFYEEAATEPPSEPGDPGNPGGGDPTCSGAWGDEANGSITWYTFDQGTAALGNVNCSYGISQNPDKVSHVVTGAGQYFGAINTTDYDTAAACGACVEVSRPAQSKKVVITIVDQCPVATNPKCVKGHIDLSQAAFTQLGTTTEGYLGARAGKDAITWKYVPCPTEAKVSLRLKEASNVYWNMVLVEDHVYPIQSVQVKIGSEWLNASRSEYNYWLPPGGKMGTAPYTVRVTDVNGAVIEAQVALNGSDQSTAEQFSCE